MLRPGPTLKAEFAHADAILARGPTKPRVPLTMTGPAVEAALIHLGIRPSTAAELIGMHHGQMSRYRLGSRVSRKVQAGINRLLEQRRAVDARIAAAIDTLGPGDELAAPWYWTLQDWVGGRIVTSRAAYYHHQAAIAVAAHRDPRVVLIPFDPLAYSIWRGERPDTDRLREVWAAHQ